MNSTTEKVVWSGPEALRDSLVQISILEPFPNNPRRGDTDAVAASLRRFGQVKPIVIDGNRIIAGHTLVRAAEQEGWSHVAASANEFGSEEERRAFLLADNHTSDRGSYDDALLLEQLRALEEHEGTGYDESDVSVLEKKLREAEAPPHFPRVDPAEMPTEYRCPGCGYEWSGSRKPGTDEE